MRGRGHFNRITPAPNPSLGRVNVPRLITTGQHARWVTGLPAMTSCQAIRHPPQCQSKLGLVASGAQRLASWGSGVCGSRGGGEAHLGRETSVAETGEGCLRTLIGFGPGAERGDDLTELGRLDVASESVGGAGDLHGARGYW